MLILLYLYLYRKDGGAESHALSNINHAVSASTVNMSKTNSENTQQSPSSQDVKMWIQVQEIKLKKKLETVHLEKIHSQVVVVIN